MLARGAELAAAEDDPTQEAVRGVYMLMGGLPLLLCSDHRARNFGILLGVAAVITRLVYAHAFASVWCFFAAVLAVYLCIALRRPATEQGG